MRSVVPRWAPLSGLAFLVLALGGNALQGSTPALHGDAEAVVDFYEEKATAIAVGMMLSLISVFFLAWFLAALRHRLAAAEGPGGFTTPLVGGAGMATGVLLAAGFALNSAGALRAREAGISPDAAVVFYDGGLALVGMAASLTASVLLAATALIVVRRGGLPRWFGWLSAVLALLGLVTPIAFVLALLFPVWVGLAGVLLARSTGADRPTTAGEVSPARAG